MTVAVFKAQTKNIILYFLGIKSNCLLCSNRNLKIDFELENIKGKL